MDPVKLSMFICLSLWNGEWFSVLGGPYLGHLVTLFTLRLFWLNENQPLDCVHHFTSWNVSKKIIPVQISKDMDLKKAGWSPKCHTWPTCFLNSLCVSERSSLFAYFKKNSMVLSWKRDAYRQLNHPIFWSLVELQNKTNKIITYDSYDVIISSPYIYISYIYIYMFIC